MRVTVVLGALLGTVALASVTVPTGTVAAAPEQVPSVVETVPGGHSGDSIDDPAIWVHPTDPAQSLVLANDKLGSLDVYGLDGSLVQRIADPEVTFYGNVDVRQRLTVAGRTRDVVAVTHRGTQFFSVDAATRRLEPITDGIAVGQSGEGLCLYRSPLSGKAYVFSITIQGRMRQYELVDPDADGLIEVQLVRDIQVGSEAEGCVADDDTGNLFVSEEDVALWRYNAEPSGGTARTAVDRVVAQGGNLQADIEGVTLAATGATGGYLIASAQWVDNPNASFFAVYERHPPHALVSTFRVVNGATSDDCDRTDGVAVTVADLGPRFPHGMFVCQDNNNDTPGAAGNQNLKFVPLETIVDLDPAGGNQPPVAIASPSCDGLTCSFDGTASFDPDGTLAEWTWEFGDGVVASGPTATHSYASGGSYTVVHTVVDDEGTSASTTLIVTPSDVASPGEVSFVAAVSSANANTTTWSLTVPADVHPGDVLLAWFAGNSGTAVPSNPGPGWQQVARAVDGDHTATLWWKAAAPGDAGSNLVVRSTLQKGVLTIAAYRGVDPASPIAAHGVATQPALTTQHTTATVSNEVAGAWRVSFWSLKSSGVTTLTAPPGETSRSTTNGTGSGRVTTRLSDAAGPVPLGPQGGRTATSDVAANKATAWTVLLRPAVVTPPANDPPTARIVATCVAMTCSLDASTSTDNDGTIVSYDWDFGDDSGAAAGSTTTHTYATAGTWTVTLSVTDDDGATSAATVPVTATPPTSSAIAFVGQAASPNANATRWSVTVPTDVDAGDVLIAWHPGASGFTVASPGAGWLKLADVADSELRTTAWWKVATAADAGSVISVTSALQKGVLVVAGYRGVDNVSPFATTGAAIQSALTTEHSTPSVTNPIVGGWRVSFWALKSSTVTSLAVAPSETTRSLTNGTGGGRITTGLADSGAAVAAGAQGNVVAISDAAANKGTYWTIVLRPA